VGNQAVDANWWRGKKGWKSSIFPLTHVVELESSTPIVNKPSGRTSQPVASVQNENIAVTEIQNHHQPGLSNGSFIATGYANMSLTAQMDEELGFQKGDLIQIIKMIDADFAYGTCNGRKGEFPLAFVDIHEGNTELQASRNPSYDAKGSKFKWWEEEGSSTSSQNKSVPLSSQDSHTNSQHMGHQNSVNSVLGSQASVAQSTADPASHSQPRIRQSQSLFTKTHRRQGSYTSQNTRSHDMEVTAYGKTLFPFIAENSNELTFFDNEIIKLIRHIDEQWMEGEVDGKRGIFPTSYVEIIVDCPWEEELQIKTQSTAAEEQFEEVYSYMNTKQFTKYHLVQCS